jgi:hypothetical protein
MEMRLDPMSRYFDVMNLQYKFVNIDKTIEVGRSAKGCEPYPRAAVPLQLGKIFV